MIKKSFFLLEANSGKWLLNQKKFLVFKFKIFFTSKFSDKFINQIFEAFSKSIEDSCFKPPKNEKPTEFDFSSKEKK